MAAGHTASAAGKQRETDADAHLSLLLMGWCYLHSGWVLPQLDLIGNALIGICPEVVLWGTPSPVKLTR